MPTDATFRLSTHVALGLACLCLGYAEWGLLPEASGFTAVVIALLAVSYWSGGTYEFTIVQANRVGLAIGVVAALWVGWQVVRPAGGLVYQLPWPISLLPYFGPLLMVLIPAKLFRPKHVDDWWATHGIGLVAVGLAMVMSEDVVLGVLLGLYAVAGVASLIAFQSRRAAGALPPAPGSAGGPVGVVARPGAARRRLVVRAAGWTALAAGLALPAFFLTPRSSGSRWQFGESPLETGFAAEQMIDLNRTGSLSPNPEVAFEVTATHPDGRPNADLDPDQHWRGVAYRTYDNGRWAQSQSNGLVLFTSRGQGLPARGVPDLGPGQFRLDYRPVTLEQHVLAAPVVWAVGQPYPVADAVRGDTWYQLPDGSFAFSRTAGGVVDPYTQFYRPPAEPGLGPGQEMLTLAFRQQGQPIGSDAVDELLLAVRANRVRAWAKARLDELVRTAALPAGVLDRAVGDPYSLSVRVDPADYEAVGKAFRDVFAASGEYRYDLELRRENTSIDPIEDFLLNTKAGHCERFASALALSLRAVGVPTLFVMGFRGCEHQGGGRYVVRQDHAHAWVEILVPRPTPADGLGRTFDPPKRVWHWLNLDPTPDTVDPAADGPTPSDWAGAARQLGGRFFDDFIVGYDPDRRQRFFQGVKDHAGGYWWAYLAAAGVAAVGWVARSRLRAAGSDRDAADATGVPWFDAMVAVLTAHGLPPRPGQTPGEFAATASQALRTSAATAPLADVPLTIGRAYYRARYAGRPPTATERADLTAAVDRLRTGLRDGLPTPETPT